MNHTTTADKGEQECREAFEQWVLESWDATHLRTDRVGTYVCLHIFLRWQAWQAAWNRRPTNEGQDGLTEVIDMLANQHLRINPMTDQIGGSREFGYAIARHLSSHPAPDDQQAKDAALWRHCVQFGFPVRNQTASSDDKRWIAFSALNTHYAATPYDSVCAALSATKQEVL